ncbi:hypothetical protein V6U81_13065 [Micromonospora sp. CPCC 205711]|uniref:hypothetical protein n=1 Tax=Micromonospora sp. CPCC 205547 TaxID=3122400 RepID=UPI002FF402EC
MKLRRTALPVAMLVLILAAPVASWWLTGDLTNEAARQLAAQGVELDYEFRPLSLGPVGDRTVGVLACISAIGALGLLVRGTATRRLDSGWWPVLLPLVGAGAVVGFAWRVLTAGGIGANIGAGLTIMFGGPVLAVLLVAAAAAAALQMHRIRLRRHPQQL